MKLICRASLSLWLMSAAAGAQAEPGTETRGGKVSAADFFFYSCVDEYMKAQAVPLFDGSSAYGVEYSRFSGAVLSRLHDAARQYALTIRAPDYSDPEHGSPAVLVLCQQASKRPQVNALTKARPDD